MQASRNAPVPLTASGRLQNMDDWSEDVAAFLAASDGLVLTPEHWEIIRLMREYYQAYNITPIRKLLKADIAEKLGADKAADAWLDSLFPQGVLLQGSKIAGLPVPMLDAEVEGMHATGVKKESRPAAEPLHFVNEFYFEGRTYQVHAKGNLVNPGDWNERLAEFLARKEGIVLTEEHWQVIDFLRKFFFQYGITPMVRLLMKHMRQELGEERSSHDYLYRLFPGGPSRQGSRIAGLPEPQGCIDG